MRARHLTAKHEAWIATLTPQSRTAQTLTIWDQINILANAAEKQFVEENLNNSEIDPLGNKRNGNTSQIDPLDLAAGRLDSKFVWAVLTMVEIEEEGLFRRTISYL